MANVSSPREIIGNILDDEEENSKLSQKTPSRCSVPINVNRCFLARRTLKTLGVIYCTVIFVMALIGWPQTVFDDPTVRTNILASLFLVGLVMVVLEEHIDVNKAAIMMMVAATEWNILARHYHNRGKEGHPEFEEILMEALADVGGVILFLLPAMGVIETIDHFNGFVVVTRFMMKMTEGKKTLLMPVLCILSFFMSAVIDNLTSTIVAVKLLQKAAPNDRVLRHFVGGGIVIAANAGGAWSPVGDVTTTMLWLQDHISVGAIMTWTFLPSCVAGLLPMFGLWVQAQRFADSEGGREELPQATFANKLVLVMAVVLILLVPILKMATGLPPYLGMLLALGIVWYVTDTSAFRKLPLSVNAARDEEIGGSDQAVEHGHDGPNVIDALHKMDLTGLLFFTGVLLAVSALSAGGVLRKCAEALAKFCGDSPLPLTALLGAFSAIVDNVPLVQAAMNMFGDTYPMDHPMWQLLALAAGAGGSMLSIGSIAGVTLMTMEGVGYVWYVKNVSIWAVLGFVAGLGTYQLQRSLFD